MLRSDLAEPDMPLKSRWVTEIIDVVALCHEKRVLIFDIALRNILLTEDLHIRLIDFANSALLPEDTNMVEANESGCTLQIDLLHLGSVIYSIATWQKSSVDCAEETDWPHSAALPTLDDVLFGSVIAHCWAKQYYDVNELQQHFQRLKTPE